MPKLSAKGLQIGSLYKLQSVVTFRKTTNIIALNKDFIACEEEDLVFYLGKIRKHNHCWLMFLCRNIKIFLYEETFDIEQYELCL